MTFNASTSVFGGIKIGSSFILQGFRLSTSSAVASSSAVAIDSNGDSVFYHPQVINTYWASSSIQQAGVTGTRTFVHNLGRVPKIVRVTGHTLSDGATAGASSHSRGVATSTGNSQNSIGTAFQLTTGGEACENVKTGVVMYFLDSNTCPTIEAEASITSISDTQVIVDWTTNTGTGVAKNRAYTIEIE